MLRGCEAVGINLLPWALVADEVTAARASEHGRVLDTAWERAAVAEGARGHQQAAARACDHLIGRSEMLPRMIDDRSHAFADRLVLQVDAVDAAVECVVLLRGAVHAPVVAWILLEPPAA